MTNIERLNNYIHKQKLIGDNTLEFDVSKGLVVLTNVNCRDPNKVIIIPSFVDKAEFKIKLKTGIPVYHGPFSSVRCKKVILKCKLNSWMYLFSGFIGEQLVVECEDMLGDISLSFSNVQSKIIDVSRVNFRNAIDAANMFRGISKVERIILGNADFSNVATMRGMFSYCAKLVDLDISNVITSNKLKIMSTMFFQCDSLTNVDLSRFNTSDILDLESMFYWCRNLKHADLSGLHSRSLLSIPELFFNCNKLEYINMQNLKANSNCRVINSFEGCESLRHLSISKSLLEVIKSSHQFDSLLSGVNLKLSY